MKKNAEKIGKAFLCVLGAIAVAGLGCICSQLADPSDLNIETAVTAARISTAQPVSALTSAPVYVAYPLRHTKYGDVVDVLGVKGKPHTVHIYGRLTWISLGACSKRITPTDAYQFTLFPRKVGK